MNTLSYWSYIGTFYLVLLTWQDYKNNRMVDDRRNFFMLGLSVSLISHVYTSLIYKLALSLILAALYFFMKRIKALGAADINSISWLFLGWGLINPYNLMFFAAVFGILTILFLFIKNVLFKYKEPVAFYGVLLLSFLLTCIFLGMY